MELLPDGNTSRQSSVLSDLDDSQLEAQQTDDTSQHAQMDVDSKVQSLPQGNHAAPAAKAKEDPSSYSARVAARISLLQSSMSPSSPSACTRYTFSSLYSIPQSTVQVHALALPACSSQLYTSGSDGFIRRYAWYASLRKRTDRQPVLKGYWENPSVATLEAMSLGGVSKAAFGPAGVSNTAGNTVPVYSLAVQQEEVYCLAGSGDGVVNLFSVRLDEGQCRASLGLKAEGHARNKPVSALALNESESTVLSGGWDAQILQWDLNSGRCVRKYVGHKSSLVSIQYRPSSATALEAGKRPEPLEPEGAESMQGMETLNAGIEESDKDVDAASNNSYDPLFDDDAAPSQAVSPNAAMQEASTIMEDTSAPSGGLSLPSLTMPVGAQSKPPIVLPGIPAPAKLPDVSRPPLPSFLDGSLPAYSTDIFLSTSTDGECLVWDRRINEKHVRRLDIPKGTPPWSVSSSWSTDGMSVFAGRRNASVDVYDLRTSSVRTLHLPKTSGTVTVVRSMLNNRDLVISSTDTVRLWNLDKDQSTIIPGMSGGYTSLAMDIREHYLFAASGGRGWSDNGKEEVATFAIGQTQ